VTITRERTAAGAGAAARVGWLRDALRARAPWLLLALVAAFVNAQSAPLGLVGDRSAAVVLAGLVAAAIGYVWLLAAKDRRTELMALAAVAVAGAVAAAPDMSNLVMLVPLVAVGQVAVAVPWRVAAGLTVLVCLAIAGTHAVVGLDGQNVVRFATLPLIGLFAGVLGRQQLRRIEEAEQLLAETRRANEEQARAATLAERARLAREIHDVLAHSLGALTAQLGAADSLLEDSFVDGAGHSARQHVREARQHVRQARQLAAEGLQETRRGIAALRDEPLPLPELMQSLADTYRDAQVPAVLAVEGAVRPLPPEVGLAVYRITQEALSNVRRHAPGAQVRIDLGYGAGRVDVTVVNGAPAASVVSPGPGGGFGLVGMRERTALLGGSLRTGPSGAGWTVALSIPAEADA
jgi:signal transduction histidine kinase